MTVVGGVQGGVRQAGAHARTPQPAAVAVLSVDKRVGDCPSPGTHSGHTLPAVAAPAQVARQQARWAQPSERAQRVPEAQQLRGHHQGTFVILYRDFSSDKNGLSSTVAPRARAPSRMLPARALAVAVAPRSLLSSQTQVLNMSCERDYVSLLSALAPGDTPAVMRACWLAGTAAICCVRPASCAPHR